MFFFVVVVVVVVISLCNFVAGAVAAPDDDVADSLSLLFPLLVLVLVLIPMLV